MAKVAKSVRIEESLIESLAEIAESEFGGNMTEALESFIEQGIALRKFTEQERWFIYTKSKAVVYQYSKTERGSREETERTRDLTTVLWI